MEDFKRCFSHEIDCCVNIYDVMALCFMYVWKEINSGVKDTCLGINEEIKDTVDGMMEIYMYSVGDGRTGDAIQRLKENIKSVLDRKCLFDYCLSIIYWIDDNIDPDLSFIGLEESKETTYSSLNKRNTDNIKIIPTIYNNSFVGQFASQKEENSKYTVFRKYEKYDTEGLMQNINNYIIWDSTKLKLFDFKIIRLNPNTNSFIKNILREKMLNIAIYPITKEGLNKYFDVKKEGQAVYIKGVWNKNVEDELKERYEKIMKEYQDNNLKADFMVFPEMLMTERLREEIIKKGQHDGILVCGSEWKNGNNISTVVDGNTLSSIFKYRKKKRFILEEQGKKYTERLEFEKDPKEYAVLEIEGVGRIGICICKDLKDDKVFQFHSIMETTILFVPMYSKSLELLPDAKKYSMLRQCIVVSANSCSALNDKENMKDIGFVSLPAKEETISDAYIYKYNNGKCIKNCDLHCCGKRLSLDFNKIEKIGNIKTIHATIGDM